MWLCFCCSTFFGISFSTDLESLVQKWAIKHSLLLQVNLNSDIVHFLQLLVTLWEVPLEWFKNSKRPRGVWGNLLSQASHRITELCCGVLTQKRMCEIWLERTCRSEFWYRTSAFLQVWRRTTFEGNLWIKTKMVSRQSRQISRLCQR